VRIAAVSTVRNEADIVGDTVTHLLAEGVTDIYIADGMSTDGTRDVLRALPVNVYDDRETHHLQPYWIGRLADIAYDDGADWVLCVDADEFWYAPSGRTILEELTDVPAEVGKLYVRMWHHLDRYLREPNQKPLPKVAFRAGRGVEVANGNHEANPPGESREGVLAIREIQYRGFEHFCRKITERCATLDPRLPEGHGTHITQYRGWTKEQLLTEWETLVSRATVNDPIPCRSL
jgi:hypothetical protein